MVVTGSLSAGSLRSWVKLHSRVRMEAWRLSQASRTAGSAQACGRARRQKRSVAMRMVGVSGWMGEVSSSHGGCGTLGSGHDAARGVDDFVGLGGDCVRDGDREVEV